MATQVILLERVENLGNMGDVVKVRPGYARNYLLPQKKALRASKENIAYFEARKKHLEAESEKNRSAAEKLAKKIEGTKVPVIRQASESGQLFGSVTARDIAAELSAVSKEAIARTMVQLNQNFKTVGLFPVSILLHPEVKVEITINIARSAEEAKIQAETGKALIVEEGQPEAREDKKPAEAATEEGDAQLEGVLEDGALAAEKEKKAAKKAKDEAKAAKTSTKKPKRVKAKAEEADAEDASAEDAEDE